MKADSIILLLLYKQAHDKGNIEESLRTYIGLDHLHVRWVYFWEKYHSSQKYTHPSLWGAT